MAYNNEIRIQSFTANDIDLIVTEFARYDWPKPKALFEQYLKEQNKNEREVWLGLYQGHFAGYITLNWRSSYPPFQANNIPEIMDFNVLPPFRCKGIGTCLMDRAEQAAALKSKQVGVGVGLYDGYGNAQKMYVKRRYLPDGLGITYQYKRVDYAEKVSLDDDLVLWFIKDLA